MSAATGTSARSQHGDITRHGAALEIPTRRNHAGRPAFVTRPASRTTVTARGSVPLWRFHIRALVERVTLRASSWPPDLLFNPATSFAGAQRWAGRHRRQLFPPVTFSAPEPVGEDPADRGHERRSAGQEDAVDLAERQARRRHQSIDAPRHRLQLLGDPAFEVGARHLLADRDRARLERELRLHRRADSSNFVRCTASCSW